MIHHNYLVALLVTTVCSACSSVVLDSRRDEVANAHTQATKAIAAKGRDFQHAANRGQVEYVDTAWMPVRRVSDATKVEFIATTAKRRISFNREFRTIQDVAERITLQLGIPVSVSPDAATSLLGQTGQLAQTTNGAQFNGTATRVAAPTAQNMNSPMPSSNSMNNAAYGSSSATSGIIWLNYDGPLTGFMDVVQARFDVSWEWSGEGLRFFRYTTKTFKLVALPGDSKLESSVSNQTGGSSSTSSSGTNGAQGSSSQTTGVSISQLSVWNGIEAAIKTMLTPTVGKVAVTPATGTVTVTDTPTVIASVEKYISGQNESLSKQVQVDVKVLAIDLDDNNEYGINWSAVYQSLSGNLNMSLANSFAVDASATSLTMKVIGSDGSRLGQFSGSQAMLSALATQGRVSLVTTASVTTLNNQPAPLMVGQQQAYLASSTTSTVSGSGATTTLQPGTITTGFSMTLIPNVLSDRDLALQFSINISSLVSMDSITSNGSTIQTPNVNTRNFLQRVMLRSGDTLVMAGFEQTSQQADSSGVVSANTPILGGSVTGKTNKTIIVIILSPVVSTQGRI